MRYWIFKCNPKSYRIDDRLRNPDPEIDWRVTRYWDEAMPGDTAFVWRTGEQRGICAELCIKSKAEIDQAPKRDKYWVGGQRGPMRYAEAVIVNRKRWLPAEGMKKDRRLRAMSVFHGFHQVTNFRLTPGQGSRLLELI
jgi:hypothetical protein